MRQCLGNRTCIVSHSPSRPRAADLDLLGQAWCSYKSVSQRLTHMRSPRLLWGGAGGGASRSQPDLLGSWWVMARAGHLKLLLEAVLLDCPKAAGSEVLLGLTLPQQMLCLLVFTGKSWMLQSFPILAPCFTVLAGWSPVVPQLPIHSSPSPLCSVPQGLFSVVGVTPALLSCCFQLGLALARGERNQGMYSSVPSLLAVVGPSGPQLRLGAGLDPNCPPHQKTGWKVLDPKLKVSTQARLKRQTDGRTRRPSLLFAAWNHFSAWKEEGQVPEQRGLLKNLRILHWLLEKEGS